MKKIHFPTVFFFTLCATFCSADTWTSVKGEKLEGEFISYDTGTKEITIKRAYDQQIFSVPETEFIHADRIRAIRLENKKISESWYTDYEKAKAENPNKNCLIFFQNGTNAEDFEQFYTEFLLRESFISLQKREHLIICITDTIPDELGLVKSMSSIGAKVTTERIEDVWPRTPFAFIVDLTSVKKSNSTMRAAQMSLYRITTDPYPVQETSFIEFEAIEERIRQFQKPRGLRQNR